MKFASVSFSSILFIFVATSLSTAQTGHPIPTGVQQANQAQEKFEKSSVPPINRRPLVDQAKLKQDAKLAALAESIPLAVDQTSKGTLPKDLSDKLKRIEKLAKELRSQVSR